MGLRIRTDVNTMRTGRQLEENTRAHNKTLNKLASGTRIVDSGDDAAGLSISEKLKGSIRSYQMAQRNTQDGISIIQTAEGGIVEAQNMLIRLRELSVQAASDTIGDQERRYTNMEFQQLKGEINRIANTTLYDRKNLLNGSGPSLDFQVGIENGGVDRLTYASQDANITVGALGISALSVDTKDGARQGLANIDSAMMKLSNTRASLGGLQSQLSSHIQNVDQQRTNLAAGNSRIRDADMAEFASRAVAQDIQKQSGNAMLVQAHNIAKSAVTLLEKA